ncbi:hypothetical protein EXIGLDRAFT_744665 [Exidia glandulosa HHB12029]|uniref:Uncharacterized protein n=1 Tax=Exidia glandulosa HHB12029 TaxID=1314781 RepID=A0A166BLC5_EXIGL|nr:hypothetical protein EXIGLDRAFT_744665 [Exidia glandulosa HHB12029]
MYGFSGLNHAHAHKINRLAEQSILPSLVAASAVYDDDGECVEDWAPPPPPPQRPTPFGIPVGPGLSAPGRFCMPVFVPKHLQHLPSKPPSSEESAPQPGWTHLLRRLEVVVINERAENDDETYGLAGALDTDDSKAGLVPPPPTPRPIIMPLWHHEIAALWKQEIDDSLPAPRAYDTVPCDAYQPPIEELFRHFNPFGDVQRLISPHIHSTLRFPAAPNHALAIPPFFSDRPSLPPRGRQPRRRERKAESTHRFRAPRDPSTSSATSRGSFAFSDYETASSATSVSERGPSPPPTYERKGKGKHA